ncbi:MAG: UDP-N-acetylmuramate--L-alanine ligase, partial [Paludibacteraceae bacterium]|nr:UDP-N-acetylmuramate--L-alanine ligase [Paludibacteraceae bacterium]
NDGQITFDLVGPKVNGEDLSVPGLTLGVPVWVNIENSVAAMSIARLNGVTADEIRAGLASYAGVYRRFNIHINTPRIAYVDDYAHHPTELEASISSIRKLYPERYIIGVFQPHLYTRTRDFAEGFKQVLSKVDELVLLPIYPARELPIPGITSEILGGKVVEKKDLVNYLRERVAKLSCPVAVLTLGAGDIDRLVGDVTNALKDE